MLAHYFRFARKVLIKNKYYTFINIFGLVCGMLTCLVIAKYIGGSLQYDRFHKERDRIYYIAQQEKLESSPEKTTNSTYYGVADLMHQYPEIIDVTRYYQHVESLVLTEDGSGNQTAFTENKIFVADSSFLKIFTFPLIHGDETTALSEQNSLLLTQAASRKYFGNADPIGKSMTIRSPWGKETTYTVTATLADLPVHSRFQFDFLITQPPVGDDELWNVPDYSTYLLLKDNAGVRDLSQQLTNAIMQNPQLIAANKKVTMHLSSLSDIQLSKTEYLLVTVAVFVTIICWLNFINQIVGQSLWRIKQISVLRVVGASLHNLRMQFIVESGLTCMVSLFLVIVIYLIVEQPLLDLSNGHILPLIGGPHSVNIIFTGIFIAGTVITSAVPNVVLSTHSLGNTLKTMHAARIGGMGLRKMLVVVQFAITTILMISLSVIDRQLKYIQQKEKGVVMSDILVVKTPFARDTTWNVKRKTLELFKKRCRNLPFVVEVTSSTTVPGEEYRQETYLSLMGEDTKALVHQAGVDENFFSTYDIKFLAGNDFIPLARARSRSSIILNKSAANALGISDKSNVSEIRIKDNSEPDQVFDLIGIVNDHHQTSLKYEMRPMAFRFNEVRGHISIKISNNVPGQGREQMLMSVKEIWDDTYPETSFDTFMLEEKYEAENLEDQYFGKLFSFATVLSIIISCMGLLGLSLLISTKRLKEIAIRKTFGASSASILIHFLKGYSASLVASILIGSSSAYLLMDEWLESYAYRIQLQLDLMLFSLGAVVAVFLFTISYHTIKSSLQNPVDILKE